MKPMFEKNKRLSKKNDDLLQTLQRMEEKLKNLSRDNIQMVSDVRFMFRHHHSLLLPSSLGRPQTAADPLLAG